MPDPTTSANPARMNEFARRGWMATRAAGDFSYNELEPLLGRWNELRATQGVPNDWIVTVAPLNGLASAATGSGGGGVVPARSAAGGM